MFRLPLLFLAGLLALSPAMGRAAPPRRIVSLNLCADQYLLALADPSDLQVEIDVSERDLAKISMGQRCKVTPEAFPNHPPYGGYVAEIAPEANRQKGTLQIKVQIEKPDHFLTPELNAKVEFLKGEQAEKEKDGK